MVFILFFFMMLFTGFGGTILAIGIWDAFSKQKSSELTDTATAPSRSNETAAINHRHAF